MRKILDGELFDSEDAELLGEWDNGLTPGDFGYLENTIYRQRTAAHGTRYIRVQTGGARSACAVRCGSNSWQGGSRAVPISEGRARQLLERHVDADTYLAAFGE